MVPPGPQNRPQPTPDELAETLARRARAEQAHVLAGLHAVQADQHVSLLSEDRAHSTLRTGTHAAATFAEQLANRLEGGVAWCSHPDADVAGWRVGHPTLVCAHCLVETMRASTAHLAGTRCEACGTTAVTNAAWLRLGPVVVLGIYCRTCAGTRGTRPAALRRRTQAAEKRIRQAFVDALAHRAPAELLAESARLLRQISDLAAGVAREGGEARR